MIGMIERHLESFSLLLHCGRHNNSRPMGSMWQNVGCARKLVESLD